MPNVMEKIKIEAIPNVVLKNSEPVKSVIAKVIIRLVFAILIILLINSAVIEKHIIGAAARMDAVNTLIPYSW